MQDDFRPAEPAKAAEQIKQTLPINQQPEPTHPFLTPEQMLARGDTILVGGEHHRVPEHPPKPRGTGHHWFNLPWPPNKAEVIASMVVLVIAVFGSIGYLQSRNTTAGEPVTSSVTKQPATTTKPTTVAATLTGVPVPAEVNQRPIVGVMIENSKAARPQAGLSQAGVVFEAVAEGGITRFLAMFQDQQPGSVGPIRSARPYYVQWNESFRATYAHVGGSPDALNAIKQLNVQDLNQFYNSGPYKRVGSRPSPHNMYASIADLAQASINKGFKSSTAEFAPRKTAKPAAVLNATSVDVSISSALYNVHYDFDSKTNTYRRSEGGAPHTDSNSGAQLAPSVVIAMVMPMSVNRAGYSMYNPIGSGSARIFQDGTMTEAFWHKDSAAGPLTFKDAGGSVIKLNPGQTWISAVTAGSKASFR